MIENKLAVITGSNRGIGKKIIEKFAANGANIYACSRKKNPKFTDFLKEIELKNKITIKEFFFDLQNPAEVKKVAMEICETNKNIDILVNNAGSIHTSIFLMNTIEKLREIFEVNFFSSAILTQIILKKMMKNKKGSIINISSSSAIEANEGRSAYAASKAAFQILCKSISREMGSSNIRINTIAPGLTDTDMMKDNTPKKYLDKTIERLSIKRIGKTDEIANTALFLASDLSSYITGQTISVDGGM
tara:strand:- start:9448 stop:10188 length:741 start_codon:yes stop_codon:yes gene_type:complete